MSEGVVKERLTSPHEKPSTSLFGWQFQKWEGGNQDYWLVKTGEAPEPGIDGGMFKRMRPVGHVNTVGVESIDEALAQVVEPGGEVAVPRCLSPASAELHQHSYGTLLRASRHPQRPTRHGPPTACHALLYSYGTLSRATRHPRRATTGPTYTPCPAPPSTTKPLRHATACQALLYS